MCVFVCVRVYLSGITVFSRNDNFGAISHSYDSFFKFRNSMCFSFPSFYSDLQCVSQLMTLITLVDPVCYRSGTVNSKSFVGKILLRIKWKFELTVHFKHEILGKLFTVTSN